MPRMIYDYTKNVLERASFDPKLFIKELKKSGVECGFLPIPGVKHIHDLHLKPGSKEWRDQVEPGYRFLFEILEVSV